jgi:hypothetical protein
MMSSCGASGTDSPTGQPTTSSPAASSAPAATTPTGDTALTIVVRDAAGTSRTWQLTCSPPGGTHPDPASACRALERFGATALPPVPKGRMCTQVYDGDETAAITGTWRGQPVGSRFSRTNGCEIGRWNALVPLLPAGGS